MLKPAMRRGWILLASSLLALLSQSSGRVDAASSVVPQELTNQVWARGSGRVIVELRLPSGLFVPEGKFPTPAALNAQRADIASTGSRVLSKLQGRQHAVVHRFERVPYVALEVGPDALAELAALPFEVQRVMEDRLHEPTLADSVPLVGGTQAWSAGYDGTGTVVAIIDTGVDKNHPFLTGKVVEEACYSDNLCPNGGQVQLGAGAGVNCALGISGSCFHGTHVAGIAAGNGASAGVSYSGVARGAQIMAVQVFTHFGGSDISAWTSDIMAGLDRVYALRNQHNFAAVNLSLGGDLYSTNCDWDPMKASIDNLKSVGIATVIATGNDGETSQMSSPACISSAVSVGSTTKSDVVSSSSNVASFMSLLAPGASIRSAYPGSTFVLASGTSMATPHVTGAFAILKQATPGAPANAIVNTILDALTQTGQPITDTRAGGTVTKPRIQIDEALDVLAPRMFADVPITHPLVDWIEAIAAAGITGGCASNPPRYCPDAPVGRAEMAVFLLRGIHGAGTARRPPRARCSPTFPRPTPSPNGSSSWRARESPAAAPRLLRGTVPARR